MPASFALALSSSKVNAGAASSESCEESISSINSDVSSSIIFCACASRMLDTVGS
jgi:hypothetical protein